MRGSFSKLVCATALLGLASLTLGGCGGLRDSIAKRAGVKVKTQTIKTRDLGKSYKKLENTSWDFFGKKAKKKRIKIAKLAALLATLTKAVTGVGAPS